MPFTSIISFFLKCFQKLPPSGTLTLGIVSQKGFNSLPNDKILEVTKLKTFADNKLKVAKMTISLYDRVENTVGKGENVGYQHYFLFPQCCPKPSSLGDCVGKS